MARSLVLTLSCCPQCPGIVRAVTAFLFDHGCDIVEHQQFDDAIRGHRFLRAAVVCAGDTDPVHLAAAQHRHLPLTAAQVPDSSKRQLNPD